MTHLPKLAVVGRPNVGKSALFNCICKRRIAIVDEAEGITRDRLYFQTELFGLPFEVIDTGGIDARSKAPFNEQIKRQAEIAIEEADTIVMVVDAQIGVTELDLEVARVLQKTKKPLCLAINKIDNLSQQDTLLHPFYSLGIKNMIPVSATQNWNIAELLEEALKTFPRHPPEEAKKTGINVAIIGRANVGKSSLINYILDDQRCIVSPIPGTTRDSIDIPVTFDNKVYNFIDTAGIRRKHAEHELVDKFAAIRTERAIERAEICILLLDAQEGITTQEKRIASQIEESGKCCIIVLNKWDLVKGFRMEHCLKEIEDEVSFLKHCPKLFISALTGRNVEKIFPLIEEVSAASKERITTHQLNKFIGTALQKIHPPVIMGKRLRVYYMTQIDIEPPRFILFVNSPTLMTEAYRKYIYNQFRETYGFSGVPLILDLKGKHKVKQEGGHHKDDPSLEDIKVVHDEELDIEPIDVEDEVDDDKFDDFDK